MLARTLALVAVGFLLLQLVRPTLTNPPVTADLQAPAAVKQILRQSCYPCHSNETRLSWFDHIVPGYWLVAHDVKKARAHLNFSELGAKSPGSQRAALFEAVNFIQKGVMPLPSYARVHRQASVTPARLAVLQAYLHPREAVASAAVIDAAGAEFRNWVDGSRSRVSPPASPNGIAFLSEYRDWKVIDSTTRFDANTFRIILGNDIAIKAVATGNTSPWPDGATFAKVGWLQQPDQRGDLQAGAFLRVAFMIKDKNKYASTAGWGWAQWDGFELKPYGSGPDFADECVICHAPLRKTDYVFTMPIQPMGTTGRLTMASGLTAPMNEKAVLTGDLPKDPLKWRAITCEATISESTMSTLFGNDVAVEYSRKSAEGRYPAGSELSLVTWAQQDDDRWFGAKMPAQVKSVEFVDVTASADGRPITRYRAYEGFPLKQVTLPVNRTAARTAHLVSLRAAVMP